MYNYSTKHVICVAFMLLCSLAANATIYYVNIARPNNSGAGTSWATAKRDLQEAINAAASGDEVWVAAGTYKPTEDPFANATPTDPRDKTFYLKDGVRIYGRFFGNEANLATRHGAAAILSGDIDNNNILDNGNVYHVVLSVADAATTVFDGFTVQDGNANGNGTSSIPVESQTIIRCGGGGMANANTNLSISNCLFTSNNGGGCGGGGMNNKSGSCSISHCIFNNNTITSIGGGIYISDGTNTLTNNTLSGNTAMHGGGIATSGTNTLANNTLSGNTATVNGGGIYLDIGINTLTNNTLSGNTASARGGGIYIVDGTNTLTNNTLSGNTANSDGGGIFIRNRTNTLTNNIFWDNKKGANTTVQGADYIRLGGTVTFKNNLLQLAASNYPVSNSGNYAIGTAASGNIFAQNPNFVNATDIDGTDNIHRTADDGLHLQAGSPAINTGITGAGIPTTDITSATRVAQPDMGAYEFCATPAAYALTGGGAYCAGGTGVAVGLSNSENGVAYQLKKDGVDEGGTVAGTGAAISFGNQTAAGAYTVVATRTSGGCTASMTGSVNININPALTPTITTSAAPHCEKAFVTATGGSSYSWFSGGVNNTCLSFGGTASINATSLNISPSVYPTLSISAWVNRTGNPTSLFGAVYTNDDGGYDRGLNIDRSDNTYHIFAGRDIPTGVPSAPNTWEFMTTTWSPTGIVLYKNGTVVFSTTNIESPSSSTFGFMVGAAFANSIPFTGKIDEVSVWNSSRTPAQLLDEMNKPLLGSEPNLVAYYRFNEASGTIATDVRGMYNANFVSTPTWTISDIPTAMLASGTYTVTITAANGCTATANTTLSISLYPTASIVATNDCTNAFLGLTTNGTSYLWSNGATNQDITVNQANIYTVTVTNAVGCTVSSGLAISFLPTIPLSNIVPLENCLNTGKITLLNNGLTTNFTTVNNFDGNTFDVTFVNNFHLKGFDININANSTAFFYYRLGTSIGTESNATSWVFGGSVPVIAAGKDNPTTFDLPIPIYLPAGDYGFYVGVYNSTRMNYNNGSAVGNIAYSNANIIIKEGYGRGNIGTAGSEFSASVYQPRIFSGTIKAVENNYTWSNGGMGTTLTNLSPGVYTATITNPTNLCTLTATYTVATNAVQPNAAISTTTNVTQQGTTNLYFCTGSTINLDAAANPTLTNIKSLAFNGTSEYGILPSNINNDAFNSVDGFTIEAWVNPTAHQNWHRLIDVGTAADNDNIVCALSEGTTGKPLFNLQNGNSIIARIAATNPLPLTTWTHIAFVYNKNTDIAQIYINGILDQSVNASADLAAISRPKAYLGKSNWADALYKGQMDEIRIWKRPRTGAEILADKDKAISTNANLMAAYHFDDNTGVSIQNRNLTLYTNTYPTISLPTLTYENINYTWSNMATTTTIPINSTNTYTVNVTNPYSACSNTATITVTAANCNNIYAAAAACQSYTLNNVQGTQWYDIIGTNGIIASINPNGENLGTLTISVGDPSTSTTVNAEKFLGRNINITSSTYPGGTIPTAYSLKLYYYDTEFDEYKTAISNPAATLADLDVAWASGGAGCDLAAYATAATTNGKIVKANVGEVDYGTGNNGFYLQFDLNHFTMFVPTISTSPTPLPVKLLSFTAAKRNNIHALAWITASEQNTSHFEIEHSTNGYTFANIGQVTAFGNSQTVKSYTFDNIKYQNGTNYYRLKMIDKDGAFEYTNTVTILEKDKPTSISVYPNPVTNILNIAATDKNQRLRITDALGRVVLVQATLPETVDMSDFAAGIYFINAGSQVFKVMKE